MTQGTTMSYLRGKQYDTNNQGPPGATGVAGTVGSGYQQTTIDTDVNGLVTWTYPVPYAPGTIPVVVVTPQMPSTGPLASYYSIPKILDAPTETSVTINVARVLFSNPVLLGTGVVTIHIHARNP